MNSVTTQMVSARARPAAESDQPLTWILLAFVLIAGATASLIGATSFFNWISESFLVLVGGGVLVVSSRRHPLTTITYGLLLTLALVVFTGAHYTYARVPLGEWMKQIWGFERNHFDRIGHFMQGAAPAMLFRELLRRRSSIRPGLTLLCLVSMTCLGIAAGFEILEWHWAVLGGQHCTADCLGAQGDVWDAQQDMQMALLGSLASQLFLARWHERQNRQARGGPIMNLLLTGATGVLGSELLRSLVEADDTSVIYVLLRAAGPMELAARAAELCAHLDSADAVRVVPIAGDVTAEGLGLGSGFATLAAEIDEVYHAAACTRFDAPADVTHAHNVAGTRRVLELTRAAKHAGRSGRLHYVSTAYVSGRRPGWITEDEGDCGQEFFNGYEWSKFEAEREVRAAADLPVTIYRPGILVGHSRTGWVSRFHGIYQVLRWIDRGYVRALPCRGDVHLDLTPADYAAGAIVRLAGMTSSIGRTFHLTAGLGNTLSVGQLVSTLCAERRSRGETGRTPRFDDTRNDGGNRHLDPYLPYLTCPKIFDNEHTRIALRDFPVPSCRVFFPRIIRYAIEQGFRVWPGLKPRPSIETVARSA